MSLHVSVTEVGLRSDTKEWVFLTKADTKNEETMRTIESTKVHCDSVFVRFLIRDV